MAELTTEAKDRNRSRRDRPLPPCELSSLEEFEREERREALRDHRWKRRKEQLLVCSKVAGGGGLLATANAKDIARYLVENPGESSALSAREIASRTGSSASTVVRVARALGFAGLPALQKALLGEEHERVETESSRRQSSEPRTPFEVALLQDQANAERSTRRLPAHDVLSSATHALVESDLVVLATGMDELRFVGDHFRHLLTLLDIRVESVAEPSLETTGRIARLDAQALVVGFALGRPDPLVMRAMTTGVQRGSRTLAITDSRVSEVAKLSETRLYYSSNSPGFVRSVSGLVSLIQALAYHTCEAFDPTPILGRLPAAAAL